MLDLINNMFVRGDSLFYENKFYECSSYLEVCLSIHIPQANTYVQMNDPNTVTVTRIYDTKYRLFEVTKPIPFSESLRYYDYSDMNNGKACPASVNKEWN